MVLHDERLPGARRLTLLTKRAEQVRIEAEKEQQRLHTANQLHPASISEAATGSPNRHEPETDLIGFKHSSQTGWKVCSPWDFKVGDVVKMSHWPCAYAVTELHSDWFRVSNGQCTGCYKYFLDRLSAVWLRKQ